MNDLAPIQTSVYSALTAAPATYPVYDAVPQLTAKPYIVIGEYTASPDEDIDVATTDATLTLHTWSGFVAGATTQVSGKKQTHEMLQFIRARLDGQTISGSWFCAEDFVEIVEDPGSTASARLYHGIARYRVRVG